MDYIIDDVYVAINADSTEKLEKLLKAGLSPNLVFNSQKYPDVIGKCLLQIATINNNLAMAKFLIEHKCDLNLCVKKVVNPSGEISYIADKVKDLTKTCLYYAICVENVDLVNLFVDNGADVNMQCMDDTCALSHAIDTNCTEIIQSILKAKTCIVDAQDMYGLSPLHVAVINGRSDIVELLLKKRALVDIQQCQGGTPLFMLNDYQTMKILLEHGADPNHTAYIGSDCDTLTPFSSVLRRCRDKLVIETLVHAGAQVTCEVLNEGNKAAFILRNDQELHIWLKNKHKTPRSLKIQSILAIRQSLLKASDGVGLGVYKRTALLPIPNILKDIILMKNL